MSRVMKCVTFKKLDNISEKSWTSYISDKWKDDPKIWLLFVRLFSRNQAIHFRLKQLVNYGSFQFFELFIYIIQIPENQKKNKFLTCSPKLADYFNVFSFKNTLLMSENIYFYLQNYTSSYCWQKVHYAKLL